MIPPKVVCWIPHLSLVILLAAWLLEMMYLPLLVGFGFVAYVLNKIFSNNVVGNENRNGMARVEDEVEEERAEEIQVMEAVEIEVMEAVQIEVMEVGNTENALLMNDVETREVPTNQSIADVVSREQLVISVGPTVNVVPERTSNSHVQLENRSINGAQVAQPVQPSTDVVAEEVPVCSVVNEGTCSSLNPSIKCEKTMVIADTSLQQPLPGRTSNSHVQLENRCINGAQNAQPVQPSTEVVAEAATVCSVSNEGTSCSLNPSIECKKTNEIAHTSPQQPVPGRTSNSHVQLENRSIPCAQDAQPVQPRTNVVAETATVCSVFNGGTSSSLNPSVECMKRKEVTATSLQQTVGRCLEALRKDQKCGRNSAEKAKDNQEQSAEIRAMNNNREVHMDAEGVEKEEKRSEIPTNQPIADVVSREQLVISVGPTVNVAPVKTSTSHVLLENRSINGALDAQPVEPSTAVVAEAAAVCSIFNEGTSSSLYPSVECMTRKKVSDTLLLQTVAKRLETMSKDQQRGRNSTEEDKDNQERSAEIRAINTNREKHMAAEGVEKEEKRSENSRAEKEIGHTSNDDDFFKPPTNIRVNQLPLALSSSLYHEGKMHMPWQGQQYEVRRRAQPNRFPLMTPAEYDERERGTILRETIRMGSNRQISMHIHKTESDSQRGTLLADLLRAPRTGRTLVVVSSDGECHKVTKDISALSLEVRSITTSDSEKTYSHHLRSFIAERIRILVVTKKYFEYLRFPELHNILMFSLPEGYDALDTMQRVYGQVVRNINVHVFINPCDPVDRRNANLLLGHPIPQETFANIKNWLRNAKIMMHGGY